MAAVPVDKAVVGHAPSEPPLAHHQWAHGKRASRRLLVALVAHYRYLVRRAVDALVGLAHPAGQVLLEGGVALEGPPRQSVALGVLDPRLGPALGAGAVGLASARHQVPVAAEGDEGRVEDHRLRPPVVLDDERPRSVHQHRLRHATEVLQRRRDALAPVVVPLRQERPHEEAPRVREHRDKQVDQHWHAADHHPLLPEVDLHVVPGGRLEAHRRHLRRPSLPALLGHRPLH